MSEKGGIMSRYGRSGNSTAARGDNVKDCPKCKRPEPLCRCCPACAAKDAEIARLREELNRWSLVQDGFGNTWGRCKPGCTMQVVRPGKAQCECDYDEDA